MRGSGSWLLVAAILAFACQRDGSKLDEVQKMAYLVKPAVVRVNAFATADFRYTAEAIRDVEAQLASDGYALRAREVAGDENDLQTGAGGSGSGFIIHPDGYILTSGHVVAPTRDALSLARELERNGAIAALVRHFPVDTLRALHRDEALNRYVRLLANKGKVENVKVINQVELSNGETLPFKIRRYSPALAEKGNDLALLKIERRNLPALPLGTSEETRVGESIWSVGYPAVASSTDEVIGGWLSRDSDLEATLNPGQITAIKANAAKTPVFQTNVAIYRGNSGGPAVNRQGQAIGISTWGHTDAEQIKFLVPIDVARVFLAEANVVAKSDGDFNECYQTALEAARQGDWVQARKELSRATVLFPNSPDLIRFGRDADRAISGMPPWRLYPAATGGVVALALATVVGGVIAMRPRKPKLPPDILKAATIETVVAPNGTAAPHAMLGRFTILNGTRAGEKLGLGGSGIRIGRESAICEIVLENPKVSRLHAEVVSIDGKVLLIDRNSSNGTYVNDQKIDRRYLQDGDIIYFGGRNAVAVAFHARG